jgi:hypothetical protein
MTRLTLREDCQADGVLPALLRSAKNASRKLYQVSCLLLDDQEHITLVCEDKRHLVLQLLHVLHPARHQDCADTGCNLSVDGVII